MSAPKPLQSAPTSSSSSHSSLRAQSHNPDDIYNWSGTNLLAKTSQIRYPANETEVAFLLRGLPSGAKVRVIGSGLTYEPLARVAEPGWDLGNSVLVSLDRMRGLQRFTNETATFAAGTPLDDVFSSLLTMDRVLPCSPGVIGIQTIAGAMATGTHGQGMYQSSLGDTVESMRIVLPNGSITEVNRSHDTFWAFVTSLGCLGIITSITVRTIPFQLLTCVKRTTHFPELLSDFERINQSHQYVKAWWFPMTDEVHVWEVDPATPEQSQVYAKGDGSLQVLSTASSAMNRTIDTLVAKMASDTKDSSLQGKQFETVQRFKDATTVCGNIYQILCKGIPVPQINCEIAVPLSRLREVLQTLHHWFRDTKPALHYPFILRCTGASEAWLNAGYGQPVCFIGFLCYLAKDGTAVEGGMEYMRAIQEVLVPFGGVPHLGKHFVRELYDFPRIFPKWNAFNALRRSLDPKRIFENETIHQLFCSSDSSSSSSSSHDLLAPPSTDARSLAVSLPWPSSLVSSPAPIKSRL